MNPDSPENSDNPSRVEDPAAAYKDPVIASVRAAKQLEQAKFERPQADAVVLAVRELVADLATKADLEIAITGLRSKLRTEMSELGGQLRAEMSELKTELKSEIVQSERRLERRMDGFEIQLRESELRQTKAMSQNLLWAVGINIVVIVGGLAIAVAVLIDAMKI